VPRDNILERLLGVVHGLPAILPGRTMNSLLCLSAGIFFDRTSVVALKKDASMPVAERPVCWRVGSMTRGGLSLGAQRNNLQR